MKNTIALLALLVILCTSCRKLSVYPDEGPELPNGNTGGSTNTGTLVGKWLITGSTQQQIFADGKLGQVIDTYNVGPVCERDDLQVYRTDFTYAVDAGKSKCDPSDAQIEEMGKWELSTDKKILTVTSDPEFGITLVCEVLTLNDKTLKVRTVVEVNGIPFMLTTTQTRQTN